MKTPISITWMVKNTKKLKNFMKKNNKNQLKTEANKKIKMLAVNLIIKMKNYGQKEENNWPFQKVKLVDIKNYQEILSKIPKIM